MGIKKDVSRRRQRHFVIVDEVFYSRIYVFLGGSLETAQNVFKAKTGLVFKNSKGEANDIARTVCLGESKSVLIWFTEVRPRFSDVAHEAFHAIAHILRDCGIRNLSWQTEEVFTHLQGFYIARIVEQVKCRHQ